MQVEGGMRVCSFFVGVFVLAFDLHIIVKTANAAMKVELVIFNSPYFVAHESFFVIMGNLSNYP